MNRDNEYNNIYDYDIEDNTNYEDLDECDNLEEVVERLKDVIGRGDCIYCGAKHGMEYDGHICFICSKCGKSVHEDLYYRWAAGYDLDFDE